MIETILRDNNTVKAIVQRFLNNVVISLGVMPPWSRRNLKVLKPLLGVVNYSELSDCFGAQCRRTTESCKKTRKRDSREHHTPYPCLKI